MVLNILHDSKMAELSEDNHVLAVFAGMLRCTFFLSIHYCFLYVYQASSLIWGGLTKPHTLTLFALSAPGGRKQ